MKFHLTYISNFFPLFCVGVMYIHAQPPSRKLRQERCKHFILPSINSVWCPWSNDSALSCVSFCFR